MFLLIYWLNTTFCEENWACLRQQCTPPLTGKNARKKHGLYAASYLQVLAQVNKANINMNSHEIVSEYLAWLYL
jgi:hypothetical protein